jgi:predicted small secreted protein
LLKIQLEKDMKTKILSLIVVSALFLSACSTVSAGGTAVQPTSNSSPTTTDQTTAISFSKDIMPIIQQFALPAHGSEMKGGVSLETYDDIMKYVVPGDPQASVLYKYLTGDGVPVMPPSGKLPDATIQLFYDWIAQGAQNN